MKNFSNPMISFQANQLLSNDTLNRDELFVKLPENRIQNEVAILWKDLQILSVELYEEKSKNVVLKNVLKRPYRSIRSLGWIKDPI